MKVTMVATEGDLGFNGCEGGKKSARVGRVDWGE